MTSPLPPKSLVLNHALDRQVRYRTRTRARLLEDGSVGVKMRGGPRDNSVDVVVSANLVVDMMDVLGPDTDHEHLRALLEDYGVEAPGVLIKALLENFYIYPHMVQLQE